MGVGGISCNQVSLPDSVQEVRMNNIGRVRYVVFCYVEFCYVEFCYVVFCYV